MSCATPYGCLASAVKMNTSIAARRYFRHAATMNDYDYQIRIWLSLDEGCTVERREALGIAERPLDLDVQGTARPNM
jgi:hypothetical protein